MAKSKPKKPAVVPEKSPPSSTPKPKPASQQRITLVGHPQAMDCLEKAFREGKTYEQCQALLLERFHHKWSVGCIGDACRDRWGGQKVGEKAGTFASAPSQPLTTPPPGIKDEQKADWFRNQFIGGSLHTELKGQFTPDECAIYIEEYGNICCQFQDIVTSEFYQIDDFLKHRLLVNRCLRDQRVARELMAELRQWISEHPAEEEETQETKRQRLDYMRLLENARDDLAKANDRYDKLAQARDKIYAALSATRRDRIDQLKSGSENFFALVADIAQNTAAREEAGRYAELTKLAGDDVLDDWHKPTTFPDGTKDVVLLDDQSEAVVPDDPHELIQEEDQEPQEEPQ